GDSPVFSWGFTAAREALETNMRCTRKIGVVGWQLGGELAFQAVVKSPGLRAAVIISGNPQGALPILPQNETPLLAFYGDADEAISPPILNEFSAAIQDSPGRERMFVYPGVGGAFMDDTSPDYHEAYTAKTWTRMLEFLVTHLEATPRPVMAIIDEDGDEDDDDRNE
ncbi:MAG TPA: dienelactone hydrolase family protein, partial [Aggregatilineales bacterium]|nr:dienelactone hydrolase family protein [Aggregatilineales bacterium]